MAFDRMQFSVILLALAKLLRKTAKSHPSFAKRLKEKNFIVQIKLRDNSQGRYFIFKNGDVTSQSGIHSRPDVSMAFQSAALAARLMKPNHSHMDFIHALKNFQLESQGSDELAVWFSETLNMMLSVDAEYGIDLGKGVKRYTSNTNGGGVFVYVKDGKILRITPIEFTDNDAKPWTIQARGKSFTPPRKTSVHAHTLAWKSMVYSPDRLLYPMKRVDFDPKGERNPQNRGISGYERISWDEALDMVASEIRRMKKEHGPGAIMNGSGSHHTWGNLGYWLSARMRFFNTIGYTPVVHNPDSWEGWYWGAAHHWGQTRAQWRRRDLRHGGRPAEACRDGGLLGRRSGDHQRSLRGSRRHHPPQMAQGAGHQTGAHRSLLQPHGGVAGRQMAGAQTRYRQRHDPGHRLRLDDGRSLRQGVRRHPHHRL